MLTVTITWHFIGAIAYGVLILPFAGIACWGALSWIGKEINWRKEKSNDIFRGLMLGLDVFVPFMGMFFCGTIAGLLTWIGFLIHIF